MTELCKVVFCIFNICHCKFTYCLYYIQKRGCYKTSRMMVHKVVNATLVYKEIIIQNSCPSMFNK